MSGSSKLWVDDRMYLVDDEVQEYIERLEAELDGLKTKVRRLDALETEYF